MTNVIQNIVEPKRLLLTWQSLDDNATRTRFAVGELRNESYPLFRYFDADEFEALNGTSLASIRAIGFRQYPAFDPTRTVHTDGVLDAFLRRLPPRSRKDFEQYRQHFHLAPGLQISDFALLAMTEAKLPSDGFSLVDPLDQTWSPRELLIEVVGHRYYSAECDLSDGLGSQVQLCAEPLNPNDANAVAVMQLDQKIGYINRFQAKSFLVWVRENRVLATIERLNGKPGYPRVYLFVRVAAKEETVAA
ncbi:HIRAN domain-containing protein [Hoeflea sp. AS60]|uniref:HIRAN domain-containing protein n=1 Tax=Hoeflea sp. AS60 TaxID=3135780 RepID=UPI00317A1CFE